MVGKARAHQHLEDDKEPDACEKTINSQSENAADNFF
jgi:hypothetical protein